MKQTNKAIAALTLKLGTLKNSRGRVRRTKKLIQVINRNAKSGMRLVTVLAGCSLVGWVLVSYHASLWVWWLTEAIVLYLAWAGVGAIALSTASVLGILWGTTLFYRQAEILVGFALPLTPAQSWASELLLNWLLAMMLTFKLAFANRFLLATGWSRTQTFCLLAIVTNLGLSLGRFSRMLLP